MYIQLFQYFTSNNLFHANQYGFRAEYFTELALSELVDRIYTDLDEKQLPISIDHAGNSMKTGKKFK